MHEADALVRDHVRLLLAPACQRLRPFARAPKLVRVAAERDRVAVDDSGHHGRQLTCGDRHHRLVHQPQALLGPPLTHQGVALLHDRERDEVRVAKPLCELRDLSGSRVDSGELAFPRVLEEARDQEIAVRDAFPTIALEQPLPTSEPAARGCRLSESEEVEADPPRAARSARPVARVLVRVKRLLEHRAVLMVEAEHVCRARQKLEVVRPERLLPVGARERVERVHPRPIGVGSATLLERTLGVHRNILDHTLRSGSAGRDPRCREASATVDASSTKQTTYRGY